MELALPSFLKGTKPDLEPHGQVLKSLVPKAAGIGFYDARGARLWFLDGYDGPEPQPLVDEALAKAPPANSAEIEGFMRDFHGAPAYAFRLRNEQGEVTAVAILLTRSAEDKPLSFISHLVKPALECLARELSIRHLVQVMSDELAARDGDLDLLLKVAPDDVGTPQQADELGALVQACVDHLGCELCALVVPERSIAVCKAPAGTKPAVSVLTATHRHLFNWAQLQRRPLVINKANATPGGLPRYKILSLPIRHAAGRVTGFLALFRSPDGADFDERVQRLCELLTRKIGAALRINFDATTSLLTRPAFEVQVRAALATAPVATHSVLYIDVDSLHVINDNFGMPVGDEVITKVAEILARKQRPGALSARIAGDRFAVFMPDCGLAHAREIALNLCRQCSDLTYARGKGTVHVSVSIGVAQLELDSPNSLGHGLANAEIACKAAKDRGRGRVETFDDKDASILQRSSDVLVVQQVHEALERDRFTLFAQPIVPLTAAATQPRFELLLRMLGAGGEPVEPDKFLSAAERYQVMPRIDRWVVNHALTALKPQAKLLRGRPMRFSINISGPSLADETFLEFLEKTIQGSGLPPQCLCFELTETAAVSNLERADRLMQRVRALGSSFALDDFGTGLSSLSYLKSLPVSVLKIDGSFTRDALANPRTESMVRAIAQLAQAMDMETIAEFVETQEQKLHMAALGVDFAQGHAVGTPLPLQDLFRKLASYGNGP